MALAALMKSLRSRRTRENNRATKFLHAPEDFQQAAMCERMRVDRNGSILSILVIQLAPQAADAKNVANLVAKLEQRLRLTDTCGKLPDGRIGVLLPDTPESGAWKVAADICDTFQVGHDRPRCEVFTYPDSHSDLDTPDDGPDSQQRQMDDSDSGLVVGPAKSGQSEAFFVSHPSRSKRMVDICGASVGLVLASPLIVTLALLVRLTSPGRAFYFQEREGLGGKRFMMAKLRTMLAGAEDSKDDLRAYSEQDGPAFKMKDDPRITYIGRFLRKTSLDELPQLWNVLKGDMSLVGPRPLPTCESQQCAPWQRQRLQVTPGLTCIWQIRGRNVVPFDEWIRMDMRYIRRRSVWYDLVLILKTVPSLVNSKGPR